MKHLIKTALFLLALIIPATATALPHDFEVDGIYYNINGTTATVTYKGSYSTQYDDEYSGSVTIPATVTYCGTTYPVTAIGNRAFSNCSSLTSINIPNSVTTIGWDAFYDCSSLTAINIPNSVTTIRGEAFNGTAWYNNQPDGLVYAGLVAYKYKGTMPEGTSITLKDGTKGITEFAFSNCSSLASINIPNSVTSIGDQAFEGTAWYNNQPEGLVYAGLVAYRYKGNMPEGTSITLKDGTKGIADFAFSNCSSLASINIPNSVNYIGYFVFKYCSSLAAMTVASDNPKYDSRNSCNAIIETATNTLIAGCKNTTIPNSVITIGNGAFGDYGPSLTAINIPNSVTTIGYDAFLNCSGLTSVTIPNSITSIGDFAFAECFSLTNINIGNSVTTIGDLAFGWCSLKDIYCYATTPPACYNDTFGYSATLHVPAASLAAYFTAPVWSNFENIVGDAIETTGISISRDSVEIQSGEQIELTATVTPANASCKEVNWYSTDTSIATVENGVVTAVGIGECDIYAYCMGMPAICHVSVSNRISLEQNEAMLLPNHMLVLNPTAPAMPAGFTVTSSDPTVAAARVMNGKVQIVGIKEGTTTITVASSDGTAQPATCLVTVYTESGDANCDGFVNINDVTDLIDYLLGSETTSFKEGNVDLNGDGKINVADVAALIDQLLATSE